MKSKLTKSNIGKPIIKPKLTDQYGQPIHTLKPKKK